ncbi:MAG: Fructose-bisphosphate aldolase [Phycisphaerae bacterium]|nr:Fructose-bisphosphate aldolase [Phycisphaerae bacterium]
MPLVSTKEMFRQAYDGGFAIGAFNVNNMEIIQGIIEACTEDKAPLILQISKGARQYADIRYLRKLIEAALEASGDLPIVMHCDHGDSFELCKQCVDDGYTSVMIDASHLPFEENIALTRRVVEYAHDHGVAVEAELGKLAGEEEHVKVSERDAVYTNPAQAAEFVAKSGCDSLAVAIGTSHGAYKFSTGNPKLNFERLAAIQENIPGVPLVLHGASSVPPDLVEMNVKYGGKMKGAQGVPEEMMAKAAREYGICKINIDTDLRLAMTASIRKVFVEKPEEFDPRKYLGPARDAIKKVVKRKLVMLNCQNKADAVMGAVTA